MEPLTLDAAALDAVFAHAREAFPEECCGAVVVRRGRDEVVRFTNVQNRLHAEHPDENPRDARTAYTPEPRELYAVLRAADDPGTRLAVFYHSHAVNGSYFSGEDRARAMFGDEPAYPDVTYLVVSDARLPGEVRAFRWNEQAADFTEQPIRLRDAGERTAAVEAAARSSAGAPSAPRPRAKAAAGAGGQPASGRARGKRVAPASSGRSRSRAGGPSRTPAAKTAAAKGPAKTAAAKTAAAPSRGRAPKRGRATPPPPTAWTTKSRATQKRVALPVGRPKRTTLGAAGANAAAGKTARRRTTRAKPASRAKAVAPVRPVRPRRGSRRPSGDGP